MPWTHPRLRLLITLALVASVVWSPLAVAAGCGCCWPGEVAEMAVPVAYGGDAACDKACCGPVVDPSSVSGPTAPTTNDHADDSREPADDGPGSCDHCGCPSCHRPPVMTSGLVILPAIAGGPIASRVTVARLLGRAPAPPTQPPRR